jgi:hypothetical protein
MGLLLLLEDDDDDIFILSPTVLGSRLFFNVPLPRREPIMTKKENGKADCKEQSKIRVAQIRTMVVEYLIVIRNTKILVEQD